NFKQDLEALRLECADTDSRAPDEEEAAHRVRDRTQPAREQRLREHRRTPRDSEPERRKLADFASIAVPAGQYYVRLRARGFVEQCPEQLVGMLEVCVHHTH